MKFFRSSPDTIQLFCGTISGGDCQLVRQAVTNHLAREPDDDGEKPFRSEVRSESGEADCARSGWRTALVAVDAVAVYPPGDPYPWIDEL
jgi:hypothetical protein